METYILNEKFEEGKAFLDNLTAKYGQVRFEHPDFVRSCGADGSAIDGAHAVQAIEQSLGRDRLRQMAGNASNGNRGRNGDTRQTP